MNAHGQTDDAKIGGLSAARWRVTRAQCGFVLVLAAVWIILNEAVTPLTVITAPLVGVLVLVFTNRFVLNGDYSARYAIRPLALLHYALVLVWQIYVAGFHAMAKIVTGGINVNIVEFDTALKNDFLIALLANSITLTPGTVTMEKNGQHLKVIWIDAHTRDPELAGAEIKGDFERLLARIEAREQPAGGSAA